MERVGIFYGPSGGSTEKTAVAIAGKLGADRCDLINVSEAKADDLDAYLNIILGIATIGKETWDAEPLESGWFKFMHELEKKDMTGKVVAIFGMGDHLRYADHFVDSMGDLYDIVAKNDAQICGMVDTSDYTYRESKAVRNGLFVGLPVDEEFEEALTNERISEWARQLQESFK